VFLGVAAADGIGGRQGHLKETKTDLLLVTSIQHHLDLPAYVQMCDHPTLMQTLEEFHLAEIRVQNAKEQKLVPGFQRVS